MRSIEGKLPFEWTTLCLAVLCLAGGLAGCRSGEMDVVDHPRQFAGVAEQDVTFYSASLQRNATYRVYLPASPSGKFAVVYLLHGGGGDYRDRSLYSDVGKYAARG